MVRWPWEKAPEPKKAVRAVSTLELFKENLLTIQAYVDSQIDNKLIYNGKAIPAHLKGLKCPRLVAFMQSNPDICVHGVQANERKCSELLLLNREVRETAMTIERDIAAVRGEAILLAKEHAAISAAKQLSKEIIFITQSMQNAVDALSIIRDLYKQGYEDEGKGVRNRSDERKKEEVECYDLAVTYLHEVHTRIEDLVEQIDVLITLEQQLVRAEFRGAA